MTRLDDFLEPLSQGIWEVIIPKEEVTEPPDAGWIASKLNVPSPGTVASYRKGRYHVHETKDTWQIHLDRYDPKVHPVLHLVDDAPLVLMISDTFMTLIQDSRRRDGTNTADILASQRYAWQVQFVAGIFLVLAGLFILRNPVDVFRGMFELIIPLAIICLSGIVVAGSFRSGIPAQYRRQDIFRGIGILCAGIFAYLLPLTVWVIGILAVLAIWMMASAILLLRRVARGRRAVPEGFYSRMAVGIVSLVTALLLLVTPTGILLVLILVLGAVILLLGITLGVNGLRLRAWMSRAAAR